MQIDKDRSHDIDLPVPPVSKQTKEAMDNFAPMVRGDFKQFKIDFIEWLLTEGKDTYRKEGFAESTTTTTHYKVEEAYRWLWSETEEYSKEFPQERATQLLNELMKFSDHPDSYIYIIEKSLRRLFKYFREEKNRELAEWEHEIPVEPSRGSDKEEHIKDRFYPEEMNLLYEASLKEYSIKSYWNLSAEERQELKRMIAQQQGVAKADIGPEECTNASSWQYPSIIPATSALRLRPIEVGKMNKDWINLQQNEINIPAKEAVKSTTSWTCEISSKSRNALENWLQERQSYDKYNDTDYLWLTKYGNQYGSGNLNRMLETLIDRAELEEGNRNLSYYSFRHGAASMWTEKEGLSKAAEQLRHASLKTTQGYTRNNQRSNVNHANDKW
jgi:integrase